MGHQSELLSQMLGLDTGTADTVCGKLITTSYNWIILVVKTSFRPFNIQKNPRIFNLLNKKSCFCFVGA